MGNFLEAKRGGSMGRTARQGREVLRVTVGERKEYSNLLKSIKVIVFWVWPWGSGKKTNKKERSRHLI